MADTTILVPDESVVDVDITDNPSLADVENKDGSEPVVTTEAVDPGTETTPRKIVAEQKQPQRTRNTKASTDAAAALDEAIRKSDEERKRREAAEATAQAERTRADEAQRTADTYAKDAKSAREQAGANELALLDRTIESLNEAKVSAKQEFIRAQEAAEFSKAADAQERISTAASKLAVAEARKAEIEARATRQASQEGGRVEASISQQQQPTSERYISGFTPRSQSWLRAHMDCLPSQFGGDPVKNAKMMAGHHLAKSKGFVEDSEDYFRTIEETLAPPVSQVHDDNSRYSAAADIRPAGSQRRAPPIAAPVSREPASPSGQNSRTTRSVTLSEAQKEAARISFPLKAPAEAYAIYARNLLELEAENQMGRLTH
jgi:hypothetical protein